jgi:hypothetical protein
MKKRYLALLAFVLVLLTGVIARHLIAFDGPLPGPNTEIGKVANGKAKYCGNLGLFDKWALVDGPSYYFEGKTGKIVSRCGGSCWSPTGPQVEVCETKCPPKEWTCKF